MTTTSSTTAGTDDIRRRPPVVEVVQGAGGVELRIDYDGSRPPLELFDRLARIGWDPPVPMPPPKHAIDWSTPDPVTGTRHSVRSFDAHGVATLADRSGESGSMVAAAVSAASALGCRVLGASQVDLRDVVPRPAVASPASSRPTTSYPAARVTAFVTAASVGRALDLLAAHGLAATSESVTTMQVLSYRGRLSESEVVAHRVVVDVPTAMVDDAVAALLQVATSPPSVTTIGSS